MQLRDYQTEAIEAVRAAARRGIRRPLISLPTGTGKTVIFSAMASGALERERGVLILAHRDELLAQAADKMQQFDARLDPLTVGLVKAERDEWDRPVVVASIQTLSRERRLARVQRTFDLVIVDECFVPGTLVDGVPIEDVRPGDLVRSYSRAPYRNVATGPPSGEEGRVTATMQSAPSGLVRVTVEGEAIVCTPGHRFMTEDGWCCAAYLSGRMVYAAHHDDAGMGKRWDEVWDADVRGVPGADRRDDEEPAGQGASGEAGLLREGVQRSLAGAAVERAYGGDEPPARERPDERAQPDAAPRVASEDARDAARASADEARWERDWAQRGGDVALERARMGAARRPDREAETPGLADALQARPGEPRPDDRGGDRRPLARLDRAAGAGRAEGRVPRLARVDRVEVLERGGDGTYGGLLPRGVVHNLEVAGPETYTVGALGLVVHNCHHAAANTYQRVLQGLGCLDDGGPLTLGVTATPQRADSLGLDTTFQEIVYHRDILSMIRAGYLCDLKGRQVRLGGLDLTGATVRRGDFVDGEMGELLEAAEAPLHGVRAWKQYAAGRRTIVFTPTIALAHEFADEFVEQGVKAEAVSGETPLEQRRDLLRRFHDGSVDVVCNASVLTEGFDEPAVSCIVIARPTKSQPLYVQMVGRGTRVYPGKPDCLVMDLVGATERLDLTTLPRLFGLGEDEAYDGDPVAALEEKGVAEMAGLVDARLVREGKISAREVNLFQAQKLSWATVRPGVWALSAGDDLLIVQALPDQDERYAVERRPRSGAAEQIASGLDFGYALGLAEDAARSTKGFAENLVSRDAQWRGGPATDKQLYALRRMRVSAPTGLSKGEASDLLAAAIARRRVQA